MLDSLAGSLIVEAVLSKFVVVLPHDSDILDAFFLALALVRVLTGLKRQFRNSVHDWARGGSADAPVRQT